MIFDSFSSFEIKWQRNGWHQQVGACTLPVALKVLTGLLKTGRASLGGTISKGQCCDLENFSKMRLSGTWLSGPTLTNVKSGLVPVFQRPE